MRGLALLFLLSLLSLPVAQADRKPPPPKQLATGTVKVVSPVGAVVLLDGKRVGKVPFTGAVRAGEEHVVVVTRPNHTRFEKRIAVEPGKTVTVTAQLDPFVEVRVLSSPRGADVSINGKLVGTTPLALPIEPGEHFVEVAHAGFQPHGQRIKVSGVQQIVEVTLQAAAAR